MNRRIIILKSNNFNTKSGPRVEIRISYHIHEDVADHDH